MVLVSTVLLSGVEGLSSNKLMKELAGMAIGVAVQICLHLNLLIL